MANYLNEFIETIQGVPDEVQRNFCLIRERDQCFTTQQRDLLKLQADYLADLRKRSEDKDGLGSDPQHLIQQETMLQQIKALHEVTLQQADEKIAIANQSYDLVDEHIKRLDAKLKQFEVELTQSGHFNRAYSTGAAGGADASQVQAPPSRADTKGSDKKSRKADRQRGGRKRKADQQAAILAAHSNTANQALYGAPATSFVPSNEPLYCTCRRPYVGQMVACENEDCEISWYHFECVGLTEQPAEDEKWYCKTCIENGFGGD
eukprot:INCI5585.1.p1 GENE.INCI5585.1~~INCI5585.1.p1  ORF type:complete len:263 (-),score=44.41 INCI5585.1:200-988(-)